MLVLGAGRVWGTAVKSGIMAVGGAMTGGAVGAVAALITGSGAGAGARADD